jgi:proteasome lid subunit RPN8/RPN11
MIRIQKRPKPNKEPLRLEELQSDHAAFEVIDLNTFLMDTQVGQIWMRKEAIQDINRWVEKSLEEDPVPEVGGFLLGNHVLETNAAQYIVSVEEFYEADKIDFNSPSELVFGHQILHELDDYLAQSPLILIGWFHTHPGHSPYLSKQDMTIHEVFFTDSEKIAIVLDSLTENYDTGIFSHKIDGSPNNKQDYSKLIQWKALLSNLQS